MVTMGFLARGLEPNDTYNRKAWAIACRLAEERGCRLLMVAGSLLNAPDPRDRAHPAVFRLVGPGLVDRGLLSQTVINRATPEQLEALDRDLPPLPIVSFTIPVGGRPVVKVDNAPGFRELMRHLIEHHGCRRIVHVRGPFPNAEAAERERLWREELCLAGVDPDPSWLVPGDFDYPGLQTIGQDILDKVGWEFDAVVACNDTAALRVMADLQSLDAGALHRPLVCGFDDIQSGQYSHPSLTTVGQPLEQQTMTAWSLAEADPVPSGPFSVDSMLIRRASCSCGPEEWDSKAFPLLDFQGDLSHLVSIYESRRESYQWAVYDLHNFLRDLNSLLDLEQLPEVLRTWLPRLGIASFALMTTCDSQGAPLVHHAVTPQGSVLPTAPPWFEVLTAFPDTGGYAGTVVSGADFRLSPWIDGLGATIHGLFPLVVGDSWYGLAIFQLSAQAGLLELTVQEQLASVLDRFARDLALREHIAESRSRAVAQEDNFRGLQRLVAEVAHELNTPLGAILSSVDFLQSRPTSADLARMQDSFPWWKPEAPPRQVVRDQRERRQRLQRRLEGGGSVPDTVVDALVDLEIPPDEPSLDLLLATPGWQSLVLQMDEVSLQRRALWVVGEASRKLAGYVLELRQSTKKLGLGTPVPCDLLATLNASWHMVNLSHPSPVEVQWTSEPTPLVLARPDELQQVWINLLRNGCQAMGWKGTLGLSVRPLASGALVEVIDQGPGIPEEIRDQVFHPFFTTKPEGEGMGLGLDICRRIVEGHGGSISFDSSVGRTVFSVWLPAMGPP